MKAKIGIEMIGKIPYQIDEDDEEPIITTKDNSSNKKPVEIREEIEYPSNNFDHILSTPQVKYKANAKVKPSKGSLRSSLPACLRENSYFDGRDQCRTLLGEKKGGTYEKTMETKLKQEQDFGD